MTERVTSRFGHATAMEVVAGIDPGPPAVETFISSSSARSLDLIGEAACRSSCPAGIAGGRS